MQPEIIVKLILRLNKLLYPTNKRIRVPQIYIILRARDLFHFAMRDFLHQRIEITHYLWILWFQ